ncbi:MBL fold metallo-hydrolase [Actinospongicola halichondriae]|uniref:MBL fold metallo-hydrolase n=1 Tax=Actinospongicola halichondriae TaxID=3236844 RepID=UPI003D4F6881
MIFEQHYLDCLSQASYFIGDETSKRAVVVDPRRDIAPYVESAAEHGMQIELVIETHFHADFLSGHLELAAATGATIAYGSVAETEFDSRKLADGEVISLGDVTLEIRHTPGHTPESISIVVREHADDEPYGVLTGDTLFIGDVGRPDLLSSIGMSSDDLASMLYDSLHQRLLTLPDSARVFPAHGAGSSCGKNLSTETTSTIGEQRTSNYALAPMTREAFVRVVTDGQSAPPAYFSYDAHRNREVHPILDEKTPPTSLDLDAVLRHQRAGAIVLDTRDPNEFAVGHLVGAVNVGLGGRYAEFAGGVIQPGAPIVLVTEPGMELEAKTRLARIGFDNVVGHLDDPVGVMSAHPDDVVQSSRIDVDMLREAMASDPGLQLVDVRQPGETAEGTIEGARLLPLTQLNERLASLDASQTTVVFCAGGFRSSIALSRLAAAGFGDVSDLLGGYGAWRAAQPAG